MMVWKRKPTNSFVYFAFKYVVYFVDAHFKSTQKNVHFDTFYFHTDVRRGRRRRRCRRFDIMVGDVT